MAEPAKKTDTFGAALEQWRVDVLKEAGEVAERKVRELLAKPANTQHDKEYLNTEELSALIRRHPRTIANLRAKGLPFYRAGHEYRYKRAEVEAWMGRRGNKRAG